MGDTLFLRCSREREKRTYIPKNDVKCCAVYKIKLVR